MMQKEKIVTVTVLVKATADMSSVFVPQKSELFTLQRNNFVSGCHSDGL